MVLEKTPENPLDSKEINPVNLKGRQPCKLIGRTDAEVPVFWSPDANSDSLDKTLMLGKIDRAGKEKNRNLGVLAKMIHSESRIS